MSFDFSQVVTKLQNGKNMTRPSLLPQFLVLPKNTQYICLCNPNNPLNPLTPFLGAIADITATDWNELS
jgi:hypothetical protein